jgi:hypothetical protein
VLAGISLGGTHFFYTNTLRQVNPMPIDLRWNRRREEFTGCFCCPPNVVRTIAQASAYAYLKSDRDLWIVLYGGNVVETEIGGQKVRFRQETNYPWDGRIRLTCEAATANAFAIRLRIPAWAKDATLRINQQAAESAPVPGTFYAIDRRWSAGDVVELNLPMPVRLVESHPYIEETRNQLAVVRGPIVYCLESVDLPADVRVLDVSLGHDSKLAPATDERLPGITVLKGHAMAKRQEAWPEELYRELAPDRARKIEIQLIPYFAWDNRGESEMSVWLGQTS